VVAFFGKYPVLENDKEIPLGKGGVMETRGQVPELKTVQALRAIAALLVVALHGLDSWAHHVAGRAGDDIWPNGAAGVDIFFVISGLVMIISANRLASRPGAWRIFMRMRITRIVPLYWIMTTVRIAVVVALPTLVARSRLDAPYVIGSYLFLPVRDSIGQYWPMLGVGWTLNYEMIFYALVAVALALRVQVIWIVAPALCAFALVAIPYPDGYASTIVVEFVFGVIIGINVVRGLRLPLPLATGLVGFGFMMILVGPVVSGFLRPITWGLPAACIVGGAVGLEGRLSKLIPLWLLNVGDASYSIYLMHPFIVPAVFLIVSKTLPSYLWLPAAIVGSLAASAAVGKLGFLWIERPILSWMRRTPMPPSVALAG
jgi:exopolysaccharide production protein ExoZ